jgi:predicted permease
VGPIETVLLLVVAVAVVAAIFYIALALRRLLREKA